MKKKFEGQRKNERCLNWTAIITWSVIFTVAYQLFRLAYSFIF